MFYVKVTFFSVIALIVAGCTAQVTDSASEEQVSTQEEALGACDYYPPPPHLKFCNVQCLCYPPISDPLGQIPRPPNPKEHCFWEVQCPKLPVLQAVP